MRKDRSERSLKIPEVQADATVLGALVQDMEMVKYALIHFSDRQSIANQELLERAMASKQVA